MKKPTIVDKDAPVLRLHAKPVLIKDIRSKKVQDILKHMKTALKREEDGVAIAAPQIGKSLRIFIMSGRVPRLLNKKPDEGKDDEKNVSKDDAIFINPEIIKLSKKKNKMEEGCLSVRWLYGRVLRAEKATIRAYDENGKKFERGATGLVAQVFQHEVDHLNGVLFIDKAENVEDLPPKLEKHEKTRK